METVNIPRHIADAMIAHAREGFPYEVCGVIIGPPGEMREVHRAQNSAAEPLYTYDMAPKDLLRLNILADDQGWEFVAIYHSHPPFAAPYPSQTDIAKAFYPDAIYIILTIGEVPGRYREILRDPTRRAALGEEFGDPQTLPARMRAYRITKENELAREGRVEELRIQIP